MYIGSTNISQSSQDVLSTIQTGLDGQGFHCTLVNAHEYNPDLLRGASFTLDCGSGPVGSSRPSLEDLAGVDCIKNAWRFPSPQKRLRNTEIASRNARQNQEEQRREERSNTYKAIFPRGDDSLRDELRRASHEDTGVLRLHAENVTGAGGLEIVDYFSQLYGTGIDVLAMPNTYDLQFPEGGFFLSKLPPDHSLIATHPSALANDHQTSFR